MGPSSQSAFLMKFASDLKAQNSLPKNIEISQIGPVFLASVFNQIESEIITESIFTGMDIDPDIAVLKGLVEMTERMAFSSGRSKSLPSCQTSRSDGFAAFPRGVVNNTDNVARSHAYHEAVERFVWSTWWDNRDIRHECHRYSFDEKRSASVLLKELAKIVPLKAVFRIIPAVENLNQARMVIFFAFLEPYGVVSGGACGHSSEIETANFRAACELARHGLAIRKVRETGLSPITFYEKRLTHFGLTKAGSDAATDRIQKQGAQSIILPPLAIDEPVPHCLNEFVAVHRCYFRNQPPFIGGELERLCI